METAGEEVLMPPNPARYLTDWLFDIGPSAAGGMGEAALSLGQIRDDLNTLGIDPQPWEALALRRMSLGWVSQRAASEKPDCLPPYTGDLTPLEFKRARIARTLEGAFRAIAAEQAAFAQPRS